MIDLRFNKKDYSRWIRASFRIQDYARFMVSDLPRRQALAFSQLLRVNIRTQKYASDWEPLSDKYGAWKEEQGGGDKFWKLWGDLINSISHFKIKSTTPGESAWMGGIPSGAPSSPRTSMYGVTQTKSPAMYGYVAEFGGEWERSGYHPPRPLIAPSTEEFYRSNFEKFARMAIRRLGRKWR